MSHMTDARMRVKDLDALEEAAAKCGLELRRGQRSHAWYGRFMNDSNSAGGRDPKTFGQCEHALRLRGHQAGDYEIGLVPSLDGKGYDLLYDAWGSHGARLHQAAGVGLNRLKVEYSAAVLTRTARRTLARRGFSIAREDLAGGRVRLRLRRR